MHQPVVYEPTPLEVDVDGLVDSNGVKFIGVAKRRSNGKYVCLAEVGEALCIVEATLWFVPNAITEGR